MKQYIDKSAVVAKIEEIYDINRSNGYLDTCNEIDDILDFIDTLEVKEVDLEKEMDFVKDAYYYFTSDERDSMMKVARHFFELGLKAKRE